MNKLLITIVIIALLLNVSVVEAKSKHKKQEKEVEPQEPHYKNGEHSHKYHHQDDNSSEDNEEIDEELKECPVFKKVHGCPFAHTHDSGVEYDPAKIKDCPAFGEGCPYAHGNPELMEKAKGCPVFKEGGHCPFTNKDVDMDKIKDCPAFKSGCPFDATHSPHHSLHHAHHYGHPHQLHGLSGKKGCPYSGVEINEISNCPAFKNGCPFDSQGRLDLEKVKDCPIFKQGCPFDFSQETELTSLCPFFQTNSRKTKAQQLISLCYGGQWDEASFDELLSEDFNYLAITAVVAKNRGAVLSAQDLKNFLAGLRKNFPTSAVHFEEVVAEGSTVVLHVIIEATTADTIEGLTGIAPSKSGSTRGVFIVHFDSNDKIGSATSLLDMDTFRSNYQQ